MTDHGIDRVVSAGAHGGRTQRMMKFLPDTNPAFPSPEDVRDALARIAASDDFSSSPQLVSFLRFVVEAALRGESERLKGYTIGVEALGRQSAFDPQIDPIVRVEATRLRRTLERYYTSQGADDPVRIAMPRGTYVPVFQRFVARADGMVPVSVESPLSRALPKWRAGLLAGGAALLAILIGGGVTQISPDKKAPAPADISPPDRMASISTALLPPGNGMPKIHVEPLRVVGTPQPRGLSADALTRRLRDAFSRFDTVNVIASARAGSDPPDYRLTGVLDYSEGKLLRVSVELIATTEEKVVWSRIFDRLRATDLNDSVADAIVVGVTNPLLQSYGVIRARDRARHLASAEGDPRYRCLLEAADAIRSFEPVAHGRAKACLERWTSADPSFAVGFSFLSVIYQREYLQNLPRSAGEAPALDRALQAARRGIELNPDSSRAYVVLMVVLFSRHDIAAAFAAGDKAIASNKYDLLNLAEYGGRLVMAGEVDKGMAMLRRSGDFGAIRPSWHHFYLFLGSYLGGDTAEAIHHAGQITGDDYQLGLVAKALAATAAKDPERARQALDRLVTLRAAWRDNLRGELEKYFPAPTIVNRLCRDLVAAGLPDKSQLVQ